MPASAHKRGMKNREKNKDRMASNAIIRFGPFQLDLVTGELRRSNQRVKLAPQPSNLLILLTDRAGQLVTREDIQQRLWGADTYVDFEQGLNFSIRQIRTALGDDAEHPQFIETVPRRGYRFVAHVEKSSETLIGSLAVLPFENTSGDVDSQFLVDGLTESIIYRLARIQELRIIPRSTVFRYRGADKETHEIGRELQVRAVVTGRAQKSGDDLILAVELIDVDKRSQTWGERFRRKLTDIFEMQENIANQICEKLQIELSASTQTVSGNVRRRILRRISCFSKASSSGTREQSRQSKKRSATFMKLLSGTLPMRSRMPQLQTHIFHSRTTHTYRHRTPSPKQDRLQQRRSQLMKR